MFDVVNFTVTDFPIVIMFKPYKFYQTTTTIVYEMMQYSEQMYKNVVNIRRYCYVFFHFFFHSILMLVTNWNFPPITFHVGHSEENKNRKKNLFIPYNSKEGIKIILCLRVSHHIFLTVSYFFFDAFPLKECLVVGVKH